ncbi:MAG: hypothetical protein WEB58_23990 [Planctomycetaceae bacterium]
MTDHEMGRLPPAKVDEEPQRSAVDKPSIGRTFGHLLQKTQEMIGDKDAASGCLNHLLPVVKSNPQRPQLNLAITEQLVDAILQDLKTNDMFSGIWQPMVGEIATTLFHDPEAKRKLDLLWDFIRREFDRHGVSGQ